MNLIIAISRVAFPTSFEKTTTVDQFHILCVL